MFEDWRVECCHGAPRIAHWRQFGRLGCEFGALLCSFWALRGNFWVPRGPFGGPGLCHFNCQVGPPNLTLESCYFLVPRAVLLKAFGGLRDVFCDVLGCHCQGQVSRLTYSSSLVAVFNQFVCMRWRASLCPAVWQERRELLCAFFLWACYEPKTLDEIRITNSQ